MSFPERFSRLAGIAERDPAGAWSERSQLADAATGEDVLHAAAFALRVGGLALGRWNQVDDFALRLVGLAAASGDAVAERACWRLRAVALILLGERAAAGIAEQRGVAGPEDACRFEAVAAQALAVAGRPADAGAHLRRAAAAAATLPANDPAAAQARLVARLVLERALELHRSAHELALLAGDALADAASAAPWRERHRALSDRAHALLDLGETVQPGVDLEELMRLEDAHEAGAGERFWSAALHCRLQLLLRGRQAALVPWETCHDFAARARGEDPARAHLLRRIEQELGLE